MERIAVFPGSFDPFTIGHKAIVDKALPLFDKIIIAIGVNSEKHGFFTPEKRLSYISDIYKDNPQIEVKIYSSLTVEFCKENNAKFIVRGLRNTTDFQYEKTIAQMNRQMSGIETIFLVTPPEYSHISSSVVRELLTYKADVSEFVPKAL